MKTAKEKIYGYFKQQGSATVAQLQKELSLDYHTVRSTLKRMTEEKTVVFEGGLLFRFVKEETKRSGSEQSFFKWFNKVSDSPPKPVTRREEEDIFELSEVSEDDEDGDSLNHFFDDAEEDDEQD